MRFCGGIPAFAFCRRIVNSLHLRSRFPNRSCSNKPANGRRGRVRFGTVRTVPLLEGVSITKSYAGVRALRNGNFELRAGEVHALVGENGAGKSTLIKVFTGAVQ